MMQKWLPHILTILAMLGGLYLHGLSEEHRITVLEERTAAQALMQAESWRSLARRIDDVRGDIRDLTTDIKTVSSIRINR